MMTKIRQMSWLFLWVLILAFIGMMVVEWGAGGISRNMFVGEIAGQKIKLDEYEKQLNVVRDNMRQSESSLDDAMLKRSHEQTWNGMIEQVVLNKYLKKYNISVSAEEVQYYILNVPADQLKQHPQLQTNGQFDIEKYQTAVKNDKNLFMNLYSYYQQNLPFLKLQEIVSEGAIVTDAEVLEDYMKKNINVNAEYLFVPNSSFYKKVKGISDEEAKTYYDMHKDEFKQDAQCVLSYVEFPIVTSKIDSEKVMEDATSIIKQLKNGEKFEEIAPIYSDDPSVERNNGDLGYSSLDGYVKEFREAAETAKIGEIVGPVKTQFGQHIMTVLKRNKEKDDKGKLVTKAHVKHILLKYEPSTDTRDLTYNNAQKLSDNTGKDGLIVSAEALSYEVKETPPFNQGTFIPGIGNVKQAVDFAFNEKVGSVSNIMYAKDRNNNEKYFIVSIKEKIKDGVKEFETVKNACVSKVKIEKRENYANDHAASLKTAIDQSGNLKSVAARDTSGIASYDTTGNFTGNSSIPKVGKTDEFIYAAINTAPLNEIYGPVKTQKGIYFIKVLKRDELDKEKLDIQRPIIRQTLLGQKQRMHFYKWWNAEKEKVESQDQRYRFYRNL